MQVTHLPVIGPGHFIKNTPQYVQSNHLLGGHKTHWVPAIIHLTKPLRYSLGPHHGFKLLYVAFGQTGLHCRSTLLIK